MLTPGLLPMLATEVVRQGELAREKSCSCCDRIIRRRRNDQAAAFFGQLDFTPGFEPQLAAKLPGNQNLTLSRELGDRHGNVLRFHNSISKEKIVVNLQSCLVRCAEPRIMADWVPEACPLILLGP